MKKSPEFTAFERLTDQLLTVTKPELDARVRAHKEKATLNPRKRGPKPKVTPPASVDASPDAS